MKYGTPPKKSLAHPRQIDSRRPGSTPNPQPSLVPWLLAKAMVLLLLCGGGSGCGSTEDPAPATEGLVVAAAAPRVLSAQDFANDPSLMLRSTDTAAIRLRARNLESEDSDQIADSGEAGVVVIPKTFDHPIRHTLCLRDNDGNNHVASLLDSDAQVLGTVEEGQCVLFELEAGEYFLHLKSDGVGEPHGEMAFLRPIPHPEYGLLGRQTPPQPNPPLPQATQGSYSVPASYDQIPNGCAMEGPWRYDGLFCKNKRSDQWDAYCDSLRSGTCEARIADCLDYWGTEWDGRTSGTKDLAWESCFNGYRMDYALHPNDYFPIMQEAGDSWVSEYCNEILTQDCQSEWQRSDDNLPQCDGLSETVPYGSLSLSPGQIAVVPQSLLTFGRTSCPPEEDTPVAVIDANCADLNRRIGGVILGPESQAVLYAAPDFGGIPHLLSNLGDQTTLHCLPMPGRTPAQDQMAMTPALIALRQSTSPSVTVNRASGMANTPCRAERMGVWCLADGEGGTLEELYNANREVNLQPPMPGEVLLLGDPDLEIGEATCAVALVINTACNDLSRLGFEDRIYGILRPSEDTFADLYFNREFTGKHTIVDVNYHYPGSDDASRGQFQPLPDRSDPNHANRGTISSVRVMRNQSYNHTTLITTGHCDECDLTGVDFSGEDLTEHSMVHSNLSSANLTGANLTLANLGWADLSGANLTDATLTGAHLGCAVLANLDTTHKDDPKKSSLRVQSPGQWARDFSVDGIAYHCPETVLSGAKLPITLLPTNSWSRLVLNNAILLDLEDGYNLDDLILEEGSFVNLSMGNQALSMRGVRADGANLRGAALSKIDFGVLEKGGRRIPSSFAGADLSGATLSYTNLEEANLSGANLSWLYTGEAKRRTTLSHAYMRNANLSGASLGGINLSYAYFYGTEASVAGSTMVNSLFSGGVFSGMDFRQCKLENASFAGAQLVRTRFDDPDTDLTMVSFDNAYLQGATLAAADVTGASFVGAFVSTEQGCWGYIDPACAENQLTYAATDLGLTNDNNVCPNGDFGPCLGEKLIADTTTTSPIPPCVPDIWGDMDDCMSYEVLSTGTIPHCDDNDGDIMTCGCLTTIECD